MYDKDTRQGLFAVGWTGEIGPYRTNGALVSDITLLQALIFRSNLLAQSVVRLNERQYRTGHCSPTGDAGELPEKCTPGHIAVYVVVIKLSDFWIHDLVLNKMILWKIISRQVCLV